jgi:3-hydroxyisobutyrate dehydrogenase
MGLATALGRTYGSPLPMTEAAETIYRDAIEKEPGLSRKDFSSVYAFLAKQSQS